MKLIIFLLTVALLQVTANGVSQTISFSGKDVPLEKVFRAIKQQTGYQIFYKRTILKESKPVSIQAINATLAVFLDKLFKDQPLEYSIERKNIIVTRKENGKQGAYHIPENNVDDYLQSMSDTMLPIAGVVRDQRGQPLAGASVRVQGSGKGATTDPAGRFGFQIKKGSVLIVSFIGYKGQEIKVNENEELNIQLAIADEDMEEVTVVNTGYQSLVKEKAVGSFSKMDSAQFNQRPNLNILDRLDGMVPGVLFNRKLGSEGFPQVRGISTLNTSFRPLIILDNFPYSGELNMINPNDVQDITILKDAAAASIWGARAGNGVIVITTKKGNYNQPFRLSINSNITIEEKPDLYYHPRISTADFIGVEQFLFDKGFYNSDLGNTFDRPIISPVVEILHKKRNGELTPEAAEAAIAQLKQQDIRNDYDKYVTRHAIKQSYYLNINGGNHIFNYSLSGGYDHDLNSTRHSKPDKRFTIQSTSSLRIVKNLELTAGIQLTRSDYKSNSFQLRNAGILKSSIHPYARLADDQGNPLPIPKDYRMSYLDTAGGGALLDWQYRPLDELKLADRSAKLQFYRIDLTATYRFASWLKGSVSYQYSEQSSSTRDHQRVESYATRDLINLFSQVNGNTVTRAIPMGGIVDMQSSGSSAQQMRAQIDFNQNWAGRHDLAIMLAGEVSEGRQGHSFTNRFYGYTDQFGTYTNLLDYTSYYPLYGQLSGGMGMIPFNSSMSGGDVRKLVSVLGNLSYTYNGRYTIYASARRDGANVFGVSTNNRWKPLWSAGINWDISREEFYKLSWMPSLKFRAAFGYSGNVDNTRSGLPTMMYGDPDPYTSYPTGIIGDPPNPNLRWEEVNTINLGLDFGLLKGRLTGSIEWFQKKSRDLISQNPMDPTSGVEFFFINLANLKGSGTEFRLTSRNLTGRFHWTSGVGFSYNKTIVTKYYVRGYGGRAYTSTSAINPREGEIAFGVYSYKWAGLDPANGDPQGYLKDKLSKNYTGLLFDSVQNLQFHGSSQPLYHGNLSNTFSWKKLSLTANITWRLAYYFRKTSINYRSLYRYWDGHAEFAQRWQQPGDEQFTSVPSMTYPDNAWRDEFYANASVHVKRGDHFRLQYVRLDYDWVPSKGKKIPVASIKFFAVANNLNLMLWRAEKSVQDPDYDGAILPPARTLTAGLNINF